MRRWMGLALVSACAVTPREEQPIDTTTSAAPGSSSDTTSGGSDGADVDTAGTEGIADSTGSTKLDVGPPGTTTGPAEGCSKVDFLFVIDNSGSMQEEQQALVDSFAGFITTIQDTLMAQDYHLMAIDTDAAPLGYSDITCDADGCTCNPSPQCCFAVCDEDGPVSFLDPTECGGSACDAYVYPSGCAVQLGAGKSEDPVFAPCGVESGRFMTDSQPDLVETFACTALVGAGGDGAERPIDALRAALTDETAAGGCHEGFLRDDAILVVTIITDEDDHNSAGSASAWRDAVVEAKSGTETAVVMLGLLGDSDVMGGTCSSAEAEDASELRAFTELFTHGSWASVCEPTYDAFFAAAVAEID
ncbi:MAG: hypothetical protein AAF721_29485, partial [Myxococcota bacterium]